jgi:hypothetical protein
MGGLGGCARGAPLGPLSGASGFGEPHLALVGG